MRKRRWMICAALVCLAMACGGCADKKKEANTAVIEGDDIKEYSSGTWVDLPEHSAFRPA